MASHSIFNYSIFLSLLPNRNLLPARHLLILDEAHLVEIEIVKFRGLSISKKRWKRYLEDFEIIDYGYDIDGWIAFLIELENKMLSLIGENALIKSLSEERYTSTVIRPLLSEQDRKRSFLLHNCLTAMMKS